jgi:hypothetical protein
MIMPREDRRIMFDGAETYSAIYMLCTQKDMKKPPQGAITAVSEDSADSQKLKVRFEDTHHNEVKEVEYSRDFLAAALMLYCRSLSIPMAKKAQKSVELRETGIVLRLVI